jgi:hypothetical protein
MRTRVRLAVPAFLAFVLVPVCAAFAQTETPGRETSAASVAQYPLAQQMPVDP